MGNFIGIRSIKFPLKSESGCYFRVCEVEGLLKSKSRYLESWIDRSH
jgi:hypothetical protein